MLWFNSGKVLSLKFVFLRKMFVFREILLFDLLQLVSLFSKWTGPASLLLVYVSFLFLETARITWRCSIYFLCCCIPFLCFTISTRTRLRLWLRTRSCTLLYQGFMQDSLMAVEKKRVLGIDKGINGYLPTWLLEQVSVSAKFSNFNPKIGQPQD